MFNTEMGYRPKLNKGNKDLGNSKSWAPLFFEDIKTNASITVDVWVEHLCLKCNLKQEQHEFQKLKKKYKSMSEL